VAAVGRVTGEKIIAPTAEVGSEKKFPEREKVATKASLMAFSESR